MLRATLLGLACATVSLLFADPSLAQCAKDTDCKGERVCEEGRCAEPSQVAPPRAAPAPAPSPPAAVAVEPPAAEAPQPAPSPAVVKPKLQRHSTGMMVSGIVMVALAPPALLVSGFAALLKVGCGLGDDTGTRSCKDSYDPVIYGSLLSAVVLVGVGVPLLVIGAKREPVPATAAISPFLTRGGGGLGLRLDM